MFATSNSAGVPSIQGSNDSAHQSTRDKHCRVHNCRVRPDLSGPTFTERSDCAALPKMQPGSAILNHRCTSSVRSEPHLVGLCAHRCRNSQLHEGSLDECAQLCVRVNARAPGPVWTPLIPSTMPEEKVMQFGKDTAFRASCSLCRTRLSNLS